MIQALLDAGADIEAGDVFGRPSLYLAAGFNENPEVVQALVDAGADPNAMEVAREFDDVTPLHYAATFNENPEVYRRWWMRGPT